MVGALQIDSCEKSLKKKQIKKDAPHFYHDQSRLDDVFTETSDKIGMIQRRLTWPLRKDYLQKVD